MKLFLNFAVITSFIIASTPLAGLSSETFHFTATKNEEDTTDCTVLLFIINNQMVWPRRVDKVVTVPSEVEGQETIGIRIILNGQIVDFGQVYTTKLKTDWELEVLPTPKSSDHKTANSKCQSKLIRYRLQFMDPKGDGTEMWKDICPN